MKRRDFLSGLAVTSAAAAAGQAGKNAPPQSQKKDNLQVPRTSPAKNIMISAANGITSRGNHLEAGYKKLVAGADTLEAAITTVTEVENDPEDDSVGLGGLPNEECVVELDSCCMHGPTRRAGSVGAVRDIKNVAALAPHGHGAYRPRDASGSGRNTLWRTDGFSEREFADRTLTQDLAVVEGIPL